MSPMSSPAIARHDSIAPTGNAPVCLRRLIRSSATAAMHSPSTTSAAAESWPCEIRYSRSSKPGHCSRLKSTVPSTPLTPRTFNSDLPEPVLDDRYPPALGVDPGRLEVGTADHHVEVD